MAAVIVDVRPTSLYPEMPRGVIDRLLERVFCHLTPPEQYGVGETLLGARVEVELHRTRPPEMFRGAALIGTLVAVAHPIGDQRPVLVIAAGPAPTVQMVLPDGSLRARPDTTSVSAYWVRTIRRKLVVEDFEAQR